ncbi:MAG: response regulator transcription factor [Gemmatimonadota bacterium]
MEPVRVLVVDDHALVRAGIRVLLDTQPDLKVVGEAATGEEGVRLAAELRPDVVVMDVTMPGCGGLAATRRITSSGGGARVLVLTMHDPGQFLVPVLEAGGSGYVGKETADRDVVAAVRAVAAGEVFVPPSAARVLVDVCRAPARADPLDVLSGREREVLALTAEGFNSSEIGERLRISAKTVDTYRQRLMEKLHLHHRSELVRFALRHGMLAAAG